MSAAQKVSFFDPLRAVHEAFTQKTNRPPKLGAAANVLIPYLNIDFPGRLDDSTRETSQISTPRVVPSMHKLR